MARITFALYFCLVAWSDRCIYLELLFLFDTELLMSGYDHQESFHLPLVSRRKAHAFKIYAQPSKLVRPHYKPQGPPKLADFMCGRFLPPISPRDMAATMTTPKVVISSIAPTVKQLRKEGLASKGPPSRPVTLSPMKLARPAEVAKEADDISERSPRSESIEDGSEWSDHHDDNANVGDNTNEKQTDSVVPAKAAPKGSASKGMRRRPK